MGKYLYSAQAVDGEEIRAHIEADSAAEALTELQAQGLQDIVIHTDDFAARLYDANLLNVPDNLDPAALIAARQRGGFAHLLWDTLQGNMLFLAPLLAWNAYYWYQNRIDGVATTITVLILLVLSWFMLPALLFEAMQRAQVWARWDDAARWLGWLRRLNQRIRLAPHMLDFYQAKNLIGSGRADEGLALFNRHQDDPAVPLALWLSLKASLLDDAKRRDEAGKLMRQVTQLMPDSAQVWLDLALNQALFGDVEEARRAIARAEQCTLEPIMAGAIPVVQGEIALHDGQPAVAANLFAQALVALTPFVTQTALRPLFVILEARYAIALAQCGQLAAAREAWALAQPMLEVHHERSFLDDWMTAELAAQQAAAF
jgi:hypothetical protein